LGFIKLPRVLRDIEVALLTDKQVHQHKSFRLGTEYALCRNRGWRWWIWHKKHFVNSRSPTMNLTFKAVERASLATCCPQHSAAKSLTNTRTYSGTVPEFMATCESEYRALPSLKNVTTSVHHDVQSGLPNRAQSKII
jgi:hypothetical protein